MPHRVEGHWVAEDGSKRLRLERSSPTAWTASLWLGDQRRPLLDARPATWWSRDPAQPDSPHARTRLDRIEVEVGDPGLGPTYVLCVAAPRRDPARPHYWVGLDADHLREEIRLHPEEGASFYEAVLGVYDDYVEDLRGGLDWMRPYVAFRPMTAAELDRHRARTGDA